jgi:hypothetical protein
MGVQLAYMLRYSFNRFSTVNLHFQYVEYLNQGYKQCRGYLSL